MANFSEEFSNLLQEQNALPQKEVPDSSQQKSVTRIWSNFGESLDTSGLERDLSLDNKENMSEAANVKQRSSDEGTDSHENGHGEDGDGRKISGMDITSVPDSDDEEIGNSQVIFNSQLHTTMSIKT